MAIAQVRPFEAPERPAPGPWKPADLERFPDDGYQYEIWHGELVRMAPAGGRHGECETRLIVALGVQLDALGRVYSGDTGFILRERPADLVSPDVAFVRYDRLPPAAERVRFLRVVPDLAVEIRSPTDGESARSWSYT
jgi:Uma2 family endonuclease